MIIMIVLKRVVWSEWTRTDRRIHPSFLLPPPCAHPLAWLGLDSIGFSQSPSSHSRHAPSPSNLPQSIQYHARFCFGLCFCLSLRATPPPPSPPTALTSPIPRALVFSNRSTRLPFGPQLGHQRQTSAGTHPKPTPQTAVSTTQPTRPRQCLGHGWRARRR